MRKLLLFVWLLLPAGAAAYHYGPGQDRVRVDAAASAADRASQLAGEARALAAKEGDCAALDLWTKAESAYAEAIEQLPKERVGEARRLRLEQAKAQMFLSKLPDAHAALVSLVEELDNDPTADARLIADARGALANAQYYRTWLMRLEGATREEWEPEIEASRQNYKLIAQQAEESGNLELAKANREDLEASIRLERMDLSELQGLPLPSQ
ncbi:MAG TPA: hypothetical protein VK843_16950 [Planctomycetota bacterium]|nr:hypothetical protein [Planctomycetota bacterium]